MEDRTIERAPNTKARESDWPNHAHKQAIIQSSYITRDENRIHQDIREIS